MLNAEGRKHKIMCIQLIIITILNVAYKALKLSIQTQSSVQRYKLTINIEEGIKLI